ESGGACLAVGESAESRRLHLEPTLVLEKQKTTLWHEGSYQPKPFLGCSPTDYQVDIPDSLWQSDTCE
ncbi:Hypothetical predicted protein, partial [Marmota monax]